MPAATSATVAHVAPTQMRRFSLLVWLVVIVVVGSTWAWRAHNDPSLDFGAVDNPYFPWDAADPGTATWSGNTISGPAGASMLRLKAADRPTELLAMTLSSSKSSVNAYTSEGTLRADGLPDRPFYLGYLSSYDPRPVLLPGKKDLTLWFSSDAAWTASIAPLDATPLTDQASAVGTLDSAYLHYVGPDGPHLLHVSCSASSRSDQTMRLTTYTSTTGRDSLGEVGCPGKIAIPVEQVPVVLEVAGVYGTEWTLTLEPMVASPEPEPSPGG